jgi:hypothetical protein
VLCNQCVSCFLDNGRHKEKDGIAELEKTKVLNTTTRNYSWLRNIAEIEEQVFLCTSNILHNNHVSFFLSPTLPREHIVGTTTLFFSKLLFICHTLFLQILRSQAKPLWQLVSFISFSYLQKRKIYQTKTNHNIHNASWSTESSSSYTFLDSRIFKAPAELPSDGYWIYLLANVLSLF